MTRRTVSAPGPEPAIIPAPRSCRRTGGSFTLTPDVRIIADPAFEAVAELLAERLRCSTGFPVPVAVARSARGEPCTVLITRRGHRRSLGPEGYSLSVLPGFIVIRAAAPSGALYGAQSLLQLMPEEVFSPSPSPREHWPVPCVEIEDAPRFPWRGFLLDSGRHFFTEGEVKRLLDLLALHKINTFQWHLTDDEGWRVEIRSRPRLTELGAWRDGVGFGLDPSSTTAYGPDGRYGGFHTQEEMRRIVAYAARRGITIVPEIEMPAHCGAALVAHPELCCVDGQGNALTKGPFSNGVYCVGAEETFAFVTGVLDEVIGLFPGRYVHIGGDEAPKDNWRACPRCQARMKAEGLKDEQELQSWFIRRIEGYLNGRGRTLVGWSEIREGGLARNAVVMDWIGGGSESAGAGHDIVMAPTGFCYLDYKQGEGGDAEPGWPGSHLPLEKAIGFEPVPPGLERRMRRHVLGGQANLWTEFVPSLRLAEYMSFPRLCAIAEAVWSDPAARGVEGFLRRLAVHRRRLDLLGVTYRR